MESGKEISKCLLRISQLIESDQLSAASEILQSVVTQHPDWVDERFQAELYVIMKQMEYRIALKDYSYLRSLALVYKYCELHYAQNRTQQAVNEALEPVEIMSDTVKTVQPRSEGTLPDHDTIWWCWLQGLENAPDIVKACYQSLDKLDRKVVVLDEKNIPAYVELPAYVTEKYQKGIIGKAHYADLVRLELLTRRGGTWIDATTWISGADRIVLLLEEEDLFFFRAGNVSEYIIFDNWFMHARKPSRILEATKRMLYSYWAEENEAKHYFIFHLMMTLACQYCQEEYVRIPVFSNAPCHVLQYELQYPYTARRWRQIMEMSDVHKLTYKIEETSGNGNVTFLQHLLSER